MLIFKALHIFALVAMIAVFSGCELLVEAAIWRRDVAALAALHLLERRNLIPVFGLALFAAGVVFGLLTVATAGFDFLEGWLIAAYILVALFLVNSIVMGRRAVQLLNDAGEVAEGRRPAEDLIQSMPSSRGVYLFVTNMAIFAAIILDMVFKPF